MGEALITRRGGAPNITSEVLTLSALRNSNDNVIGYKAELSKSGRTLFTDCFPCISKSTHRAKGSSGSGHGFEVYQSDKDVSFTLSGTELVVSSSAFQYDYYDQFGYSTVYPDEVTVYYID